MRMLGHWSTLADTLTEAATETPGDTLVDLEPRHWSTQCLTR